VKEVESLLSEAVGARGIFRQMWVLRGLLPIAWFTENHSTHFLRLPLLNQHA